MNIWISLLTALTSAVVFDAGVEYFAYDVKLRWYFPEPDQVAFELWLPIRYESTYGWAGVAFIDVKDARDNFRGDYYIAMTSDGLMTDRYAELNGFSQTDEDQGCTTDIRSWREYTPGFVLYCWQRKLITDDKACDVDLFRDKPLMVKWALGPVIDGAIEQHSMRNMGIEYVVLSQYYLDNNEDERHVYGPWYNIHPLDQKWKDTFGSPFGPEAFPPPQTEGTVGTEFPQ